MQTPATENPPSVFRSPRRLILAGLGVVCVALAVVGAILPGLPTTIFLIAATYLFARSCPWLEQRLLRNRFFSPYMRYIDHEEPMPRRARIAAMAMMWLAVLSSLSALAAVGRLQPWLALLLLIAAVLGTVTIARFRTGVPQKIDSSSGLRNPARRP